MTQPANYPGQAKPDRPGEITAADIAAALECDNPACGCHHMGGNGWQTHCPCHADHDPSFSINEGNDGKILVHCHAGCDQDEIMAELRDRDLWPSLSGSPGTYSAKPPKGKLEESYSYGQLPI